MLKKVIKFFRPVIWVMIKVYYRIFNSETRGVKVVLTHEDEILFLKHTYGREYHFPGGGLKKAEDPEAGARREVMEELGIKLDKLTFIKAIVPDIKYEYRKNTIYIFTSEVSDKNIHPASFEIETVIWRKVSERPSLGHTSYEIFKAFQDSRI